MHALEAEPFLPSDLADLVAQGAVDVLPAAIAIAVGMFGIMFAFKWMKALIGYDGYSTSSYSDREALSTLPVRKSSAMLERQQRERIAALPSGRKIVLSVPHGCQCAACNPDAEQKALIAGMLAAPPLHEWRGWKEYAAK
jgi:hypothetical protein